MNRFIDRVKSTIAGHGMIPRGSAVCAALSGGPDSTALAEALAALSGPMGFTLNACHFDHAFREDSAKDAEAAAALARRLGIEMKMERNEKGRPAAALQETGRRLRYSFFERLLDSGYAGLIATGHTMDDSVETSIMWMLRGTGPAGFSGIPPVRERYIRPLIETRKRDILAWLRERGASFREDPSNLTEDYLRNRIRHHLIPAMEREAGDAVAAVARLARIVRAQELFVDRMAEELIERAALSVGEGAVTLDPGRIAGEPEALRWSVYRTALKSAGLDPARVSFERVEAIDRAVVSGSLGREVEVPGGYAVRLDHGGLSFRVKKAIPFIVRTPFSCPLKVELPEGRLAVEKGRREGEVADLDRIPPGAVFRTRRPGDWLGLENLEGRKTLKSFFIDRKTPSGIRDVLPVLVKENEVLWVPGLFLAPSIAAGREARNTATLRWAR
ncbi:MAG: tRNA lysidine(34) synthetase TilS [Candidatus Nitrospinota bacterium M3_3B_026]